MQQLLRKRRIRFNQTVKRSSPAVSLEGAASQPEDVAAEGAQRPDAAGAAEVLRRRPDAAAEA